MQKHRRAWIVVALAVVALVPMTIAYGFARNASVNGSRASCLDWVVKSPAATTSTTWVDVPGMRVKDTLAQNFVVQLSGMFDGSDVQLRVVDNSVGGKSLLAPGATIFRVGSVPTGFSFTWVGSNPSQHQHTFQLQWRLPSSGSTTMSAGDLTLLYQGAPTPFTC